MTSDSFDGLCDLIDIGRSVVRGYDDGLGGLSTSDTHTPNIGEAVGKRLLRILGQGRAIGIVLVVHFGTKELRDGLGVNLDRLLDGAIKCRTQNQQTFAVAAAVFGQTGELETAVLELNEMPRQVGVHIGDTHLRFLLFNLG